MSPEDSPSIKNVLSSIRTLIEGTSDVDSSASESKNAVAVANDDFPWETPRPNKLSLLDKIDATLGVHGAQKPEISAETTTTPAIEELVKTLVERELRKQLNNES